MKKKVLLRSSGEESHERSDASARSRWLQCVVFTCRTGRTWGGREPYRAQYRVVVPVASGGGALVRVGGGWVLVWVGGGWTGALATKLPTTRLGASPIKPHRSRLGDKDEGGQY